MYLTNKAQHSVTIMLDIMLHSENHSVPVRILDITNRHSITISYASGVLVHLVQAGLVRGKRGPHGGYKLNKSPNQITIMDIIYAAQSPIKLKDCGKMDCLHSTCVGNYLWTGMILQAETYLSKITLADVLSEK
mgnify:CR=1 FL=1